MIRTYGPVRPLIRLGACMVTWSIYGLIENLHVLAFMLRLHAFEAGGVLLAYGYEDYVR